MTVFFCHMDDTFYFMALMNKHKIHENTTYPLDTQYHPVILYFLGVYDCWGPNCDTSPGMSKTKCFVFSWIKGTCKYVPFKQVNVPADLIGYDYIYI